MKAKDIFEKSRHRYPSVVHEKKWEKCRRQLDLRRQKHKEDAAITEKLKPQNLLVSIEKRLEHLESTRSPLMQVAESLQKMLAESKENSTKVVVPTTETSNPPEIEEVATTTIAVPPVVPIA